MKLTNAIKLLSQYGKVKQDETGARIEINGWTYGASELERARGSIFIL